MKKPAVIAIVCLVVLGAAAVLSWPGITQWLRLREARADLLRSRVYEVVRAHESEVFERIARRFAEFRRGAVTEAEFTNFASGELSVVASRRLANAADSAVHALMADVISNARELAAHPGDDCFKYLFPHVAGPPDVANKLSAEAQARTFERVAEVIRTSAELPLTTADGTAVREKLSVLVNDFFAEYGTDAQMIANAEDPRVDRGKVCEMTIALYERIMAWPPAEASALIRLAAPRPDDDA